jgi:hypothetical protein
MPDVQDPPSAEDIDTFSRNDAEGGTVLDEATPRKPVDPQEVDFETGIDTFSRNDAEGGTALDDEARG